MRQARRTERHLRRAQKNGEMTETITAWQCIGCGKIESPQECIGVCTNRKVAFVYAEEYQEAQERIETLNAFLWRLVHTTPRNGHWEESFRQAQSAARELLR